MPVLKMLTADVAISVALKDELGAALDIRDNLAREVREAEALLAHVTARVQKRKVSLAKYEATVLDLRVKVHMLGLDRDFDEALMGFKTPGPKIFTSTPS